VFNSRVLRRIFGLRPRERERERAWCRNLNNEKFHKLILQQILLGRLNQKDEMDGTGRTHASDNK
jgi:hypothetical protein